MIALAYAAARYLLTPDSFGAYGFYRGDALAERAMLPLSYGGEKSCAECHEKINLQIANSSHRDLGCENCHGPSQAHVVKSKDESLNPPKLHKSDFCLRCHLDNQSRPGKFPQIEEPDHSEGDSCFDCHQPHNPEEEPE